MDDLVERLLKHATIITDPIVYAEDRDVADSMREAAARIQALETERIGLLQANLEANTQLARVTLKKRNLETSLAEVEGQLAALKDPQAVHVSMLRGSIAKPSPKCAWHLYQRDLLDAMPLDFRAEAEGRVIAEVVAWCLREMYEPFTPLERAKALKSISTALETGEWRNAQSV